MVLAARRGRDPAWQNLHGAHDVAFSGPREHCELRALPLDDLDRAAEVDAVSGFRSQRNAVTSWARPP